MKYFGKHLFAVSALACSVILSGCGDDEPTVEIQVESKIDPADGLDLQLVGGLVTKVKTAKELEKKLNDPEQGINNLDLDENGEVDYIRVEGFGEAPNIGYSLGVAFAEDDVQEVATLHVEQTENEEAEVVVQGNRHVYGENHYYAHSVPRQNFYLYNHMYAPGYVVYRSPYYYGHYPTYYRPYRRVSTVSYRSRTSTMRSSSRFTQKKASTFKPKSMSPYASKTSSSFKRSVGSTTAMKTSSGFKKTTGSTASKPTSSSTGFKKTTGSTSSSSTSSSASGFKKTTGSTTSSKPSSSSTSSGYKKSSTFSSSGFKQSPASSSRSSSSFKKSSTSKKR